MVDSEVLVLNQSYEPLNLCRVRRAVVLVFRGAAEVLENGRGELHASTQIFTIPSVIRLVYRVKRPRHQRKLTRLEVFHRDKFTCQYCGKYGTELTLDHVIPRRLGGEHCWRNLVSACSRCNRHKGGQLLEQSGMKLLKQPQAPHNDGFYIPYIYANRHDEWRKYLSYYQLNSLSVN
jgi:5-methylcytosine-specific restriction endonuclease McrA